MHSNPRRTTNRLRDTYAATYMFDGDLGHQADEPLSRLRDTVGELRERDVEIEFRGAEATFDVDGGVTELTARFSAPTKGTVGRVSTRAGMPTSGSPRRIEPDEGG